MTKLKLSYLGNIVRRQDCLEKTILGKIEGSRTRGTPNVRWIGSIKEATGMSRGAEQGWGGLHIGDVTLSRVARSQS